MTLAFGTWQDIAYTAIAKGSKGERVNWHAQRLIQEKYSNPIKCPTKEAEIFHGRAQEIVRKEDEIELPLDKEENL